MSAAQTRTVAEVARALARGWTAEGLARLADDVQMSAMAAETDASMACNVLRRKRAEDDKDFLVLLEDALDAEVRAARAAEASRKV